jgi:LysM repeat protein
MNIGRFYTFTPSRGKAVTMRRGDGAPKMTAGGGGWETVDRPRRTGFTEWVGGAPYEMDIPVLFDGWASGRSQEAAISMLNQMKMSPGPWLPPPTVKITGLVPVKGATWVIQNIEWGDSVIWQTDGDGGYRVRQDAVVQLLQFIAEDRLTIRKQSPPIKLHIVRKGETLAGISKREYGSTKYVAMLKKANNIRDPNHLKQKSTVKLPPVSKPTAKKK